MCSCKFFQFQQHSACLRYLTDLLCWDRSSSISRDIVICQLLHSKQDVVSMDLV